VQQQVAPLLLSAFTGAATELAAASKEDTAIALAPAGVLYGTVKSSDKGSGSGSSGKGSSKAAASKNANRKGKDAEEVTLHHLKLTGTRRPLFSFLF
jgi:hypothetical protein